MTGDVESMLYLTLAQRFVYTGVCSAGRDDQLIYDRYF